MSKTSQNWAIKIKVIFGFSLVFIAFIAASYFAYLSFNKMLNAVEVIAHPDKKLIRIDSIMATVIKTENILQEYNVSKSSEKLEKYYEQVSLIDRQLQLLKEDVDYNKEEKLDSVLSLLNEKLINFESFLKLQERRDEFDFYDKALKELEVQIKTRKENKTDTADTEISLGETEEQKGWLKRLFSPKDDLAKTSEDSLSIRAESVSSLNADSVKRVLAEVRAQQAMSQRRLDQQELKYLSNNSQVMDNIYELVRQIKQEQQLSSEDRSAAAKETLDQSLARIGVILALVLISTAVIIYLIFADITKSEYYKRKLQLAKVEAERLARVKEDFLANMSHEIRTPLTAILGFTKQLQNTSLDGQQAEYLNAVDNSSEHLLSLVNDVLDFSKIEAGELKFEKSAFDIVRVVRQVNMDLLPQAEKKNVTLNFTAKGEDLRFLQGDAFRLKQVLYNLIYNAIKFTEQGSISVRCLLAPLDKKRVKVQISVEDTGVGISSDKLKEIFGAFSQTDASNTRKYGGTGLGLTISKKLVEAQGGRIEVDSEVGKGSAFTVLLLLEKASEEAVQASVQVQPSAKNNFSGYRLLVIDDDILNMRLVEVILKKWGVDARIVHSGIEGVQYLKEESFDLILCDLQMPEMDGETVARTVRELEQDKEKRTPFIAFTARILKDDWAHYHDVGMDDYLLKPFTEEDMYCLLSKYLAPQQEGEPGMDIIEKAGGEEEITKSSELSLHNIRKFIGDDDEALGQYLETFLAGNAANLEHLGEALETEDLQKASFYAHKMVPGVQQLEVKELTADLKKLELLSSDGTSWDSNTGQLVQQVIDQMRILLRRVEHEMDRLGQKAS